MMIDDETMNEEWEIVFSFFFLQRKFVDVLRISRLNEIKKLFEVP